MTEQTYHLPERLQEIVDEFRDMDRQEKLELLLEYSDRLPPLPEHYSADKHTLEQVHECMTPVFIAAEGGATAMTLHFDIPPESPTVRGFAEIMRQGTAGASPIEVLQVPSDFFHGMGLQAVLSPQRLNGIHFMLAHIKRLATRALSEQ